MTNEKNIYLSIILGCLILLFSCEEHKIYSNLTLIPIDPTTAEQLKVGDIFEYSFANITLPDSVYFGNIDHIKSDDRRLYLFDPSKTKTVTILDKNGNYINQLKRIGNGPAEYTQPFAFDIDTNNDHLLLYDRSRLYIHTYKLPSLDLVSTKRIDSYLMNFEVINEGNILTVRDDTKDRNKLFGLEIWNREFEVVKNEISDMRNAVIELSYPSSIGQSRSALLYAHPFNGLISSIGPTGLTPQFKLDFGKWEIPEKLYSIEDAIPFERALRKNKYALWTRFLIHDLSTGKQKNYKNIEFYNNGLKLPIPLGLEDDTYITLIWPKDIDRNKIPAEYIDVFEKSLATKLPIILYLKLKS